MASCQLTVQFEATTGEGVGDGTAVGPAAPSGTTFEATAPDVAVAVGDGDGDGVGDIYGIVATQQ